MSKAARTGATNKCDQCPRKTFNEVRDDGKRLCETCLISRTQDGQSETVAAPLVAMTVHELNVMIIDCAIAKDHDHSRTQDGQGVLDELHERALMEDRARAATPDGDEWMRGYLIAQMEWSRPWPTDRR
jgi:hypothetical protein